MHGIKQSINQARWPDFYKYTRLPVTRWVKLSLNFELLVKKVMKFVLSQPLFNNNIFKNLNYSASKKQPRKLNKRKLMNEISIKEN